MTTIAPARCEILGSRISVADVDEVVDALCAMIEQQRREYVCVSNVHTTVMGWRDPVFRAATNGAAIATPDGVPLIWASRLVRGPSIHGRASGPDIMACLFDRESASRRHHRHYFYGSTPETLERLVAALRRRWPSLEIAGHRSPPFRALSAQEEAEEAALINAAQPDIVWVGLGAPKQELWMPRNRGRLDASVLIGVGAAFDFLSGTKPRAPLWMQKAGLEWAFRLASEPRRLFGRYAVNNSLFVLGVAAQTAQSLFASRAQRRET